MNGVAAGKASGPCRFAQVVLFVVIVATSLALPLIPFRLLAKIGVALFLVLPGLILARVNRAAFVPALFFVINAIMSPFAHLAAGGLSLSIPQLYFLPPIVVYLGFIIAFPGLRREVHWLRRGRFNRISTILVIVLVVGTAVALVLWALFIADDLEQYREFVPDISLPLLILYGLLFPVANSVFEEFMSRAVMYDGFAALIPAPVATILAQATLFALWHFNGFPGGLIGVALVFVWSVFLGYIRHTSGGLLAPLVAHFFADLTIAILIFVLVIG